RRERANDGKRLARQRSPRSARGGPRRTSRRRRGDSRVASKAERVVLDVAGREVPISNPSKVYFPEAHITKLDVVRYYLAVADGALHGAGGRPNVRVRYADGIHGDFFYQKRDAALAVAGQNSRSEQKLATSKWRKDERHGEFLDYNQNAKDRTVAGAYSMRTTPDAPV